MSRTLVTLVLLAAYSPLLLMGLLWTIALVLRLLGKPRLAQWLKARTSIPQPEPNPPPHAARGERP